MSGDTHNDHSNPAELLLTRDGHLTELSAARHDLKELSQSETDVVQSHLDECALCRKLFAVDRAFDEELVLPSFDEVIAGNQKKASPAPISLTERKRERAWQAPTLVAALAIAASVMLWWHNAEPEPQPVAHLKLPSVPSPEFRTKGSPLTLEVFVQTGEQVLRAEPGDALAPGHRLGFKISAPEGGHLVIAGIDSKREPYLCYPQASQGASSTISPGTQQETLQEAIVLDDTPGQERLVAVLCPQPFHYREVADALVRATELSIDAPLPRLLTGCSQRDMIFAKEAGKVP